MVLSLLLGPIMFAHGATDNYAGSPMGDADPFGSHEMSLSCAVQSCAPFDFGVSTRGVAPTDALPRRRIPLGADALLRSFCLDCDPPIPRGAFSQI